MAVAGRVEQWPIGNSILSASEVQSKRNQNMDSKHHHLYRTNIYKWAIFTMTYFQWAHFTIYGSYVIATNWPGDKIGKQCWDVVKKKCDNFEPCLRHQIATFKCCLSVQPGFMVNPVAISQASATMFQSKPITSIFAHCPVV